MPKLKQKQHLNGPKRPPLKPGPIVKPKSKKAKKVEKPKPEKEEKKEEKKEKIKFRPEKEVKKPEERKIARRIFRRKSF